LLQIGAFDALLSGQASSPHAFNGLWRLLSGASSLQLEHYLGLSPEMFQKELEFAKRITSHWKRG
jgi:hypothetical protein